MRKSKTNKVKPVYKAGDPLTSINPKGESLTIEKIKEFPGHEHLTDEEAENLLYKIMALADIMYDCLTQNEEKQNNEES